MKAVEDFLVVVLHAYIVAAAESLCDTVGGSIAELSEAVVNNFVKIALLVPDFTTAEKSNSASTRPPR